MKGVTTVSVIKADRSKRMKIPLLVVLTAALVSESGCSGVKNVRCQGVYREGATLHNETGTKAALGFDIQRADSLAKIFAPKGWQGYVNVSYVSDPDASITVDGSAALLIEYENGNSVGAEEKDKGEIKSLIYDPVDGWVTYEDQKANYTKWFSGICRPEIDSQ